MLEPTIARSVEAKDAMMHFHEQMQGFISKLDKFDDQQWKMKSNMAKKIEMQRLVSESNESHKKEQQNLYIEINRCNQNIEITRDKLRKIELEATVFER